jgi:hypothetical protein
VAVAVSGPDSCRSCPVCQALAALREADPDAVHRLELAAAGLITAVRELFAGPAPDHPWHPPAESPAPAWLPIEIGD